MGDSTVLPFGKYKGLTLGQAADADPGYALWLSGSVGKFALTKTFEFVKKNHPDVVEAARQMASGKCRHCWTDKKEGHSCSMTSPAYYHFHPYGKR